MKDNKEQPRQVSTCFEGLPSAEMMQKIMGEKGIGSLCEEMMRSLMNGSHEAKSDPRMPEEGRPWTRRMIRIKYSGGVK